MNTTVNKLKQLKQRIKTAAIVSGVAISSLGMPQQASAHNSQDKNSTELKLNKITSGELKRDYEDNLHKYFYENGEDKGINIDAKDIASSLKAAGISSKSPECEKFLASYMKHVDENNKITFWNFNKVLSETLSAQQAGAFCDALHQSFKAKENSQEKADLSKQNQGDVKTIKNDKAYIQYKVGENGVSVKGKVSVNVGALLPSTYKLNNGQYKCGTSSHFKLMTARNLETAKIRSVIMDHYVCNDLLNSQEASNPVVKDFMKKHQEDMKKHGLSVDAKGNFVQKDKQAAMKLMQNAQTR